MNGMTKYDIFMTFSKRSIGRKAIFFFLIEAATKLRVRRCQRYMRDERHACIVYDSASSSLLDSSTVTELLEAAFTGCEHNRV